MNEGSARVRDTHPMNTLANKLVRSHRDTAQSAYESDSRAFTKALNADTVQPQVKQTLQANLDKLKDAVSAWDYVLALISKRSFEGS